MVAQSIQATRLATRPGFTEPQGDPFDLDAGGYTLDDPSLVDLDGGGYMEAV